MDAMRNLTLGRGGFVSRDGRRSGSGAQSIAETVDGSLGEMDLLLDGLGALPVRRRERGYVYQQFGITENSGERIADFVRGAGGKAAEGSKLFGVIHLLLHGIQIHDGRLRQADGLHQFAREEVELPAGQRTQEKHGAEHKAQAKSGDTG